MDDQNIHKKHDQDDLVRHRLEDLDSAIDALEEACGALSGTHVPLDVVVACINALHQDLPRVKAAAARLKEAIAPRRSAD